MGSATFPPFVNSSDAQLDAWGTKAIANCKPDNPTAHGAVALIELYHDGLPRVIGSELWKHKTRRLLNKSADEYLNVQFGWLPLAQDVTDFLSGVVNFDLVASQYERDAGRVVRRRYKFPSVKSVTTTPMAGGGVNTSPSSATLYDPKSLGGKTWRTRETSTSRWFSGAFTYYIPTAYGPRDSLRRHASVARHVLGLELTPTVLWEVAPWSWAVDWFTNAGDVISNFQSFVLDGMVMRYGYVMEHTITTDTYTLVGPTGLQSGGVVPDVVRMVSETKCRRRATPFGFGLTLSGLSIRQKAIAAAVGITHLFGR
jgi:hypothetical protein